MKFYSDQDGVNEVYDLTYQPTNNNVGVAPVWINEGQLWVKYEPSKNVDLNDDDGGKRASFEAAIFQIPKQWTVVCWLTEIISSVLASQDSVKSAEFSVEILGQLIKAIITFY